MNGNSRWFAVALVLFVCGTLQAADDVQPVVKTDAVKAIELTVGDAAPAFKGTDDQGKAWDSAEHLGKNYTVVYFYPADFTGGCIKQAETFRDTMNQLADRGVTVIGISGDAAKNHKLFKESWKLNYTLLADEAGEIATQFGVPQRAGGQALPIGPDRKPLLNEAGEKFRIERKTTFARWTFLIGKDGKVLYKNTKVVPATDAKQVLEFIQKEQAGGNVEAVKTP
ncbi:MAG: peroxiredoxin [Planctomycetales bacterium]|nr:peroxiredoxin [Planctomycetales bacterium]